jgi:hypothetical protein
MPQQRAVARLTVVVADRMVAANTVSPSLLRGLDRVVSLSAAREGLHHTKSG